MAGEPDKKLEDAAEDELLIDILDDTPDADKNKPVAGTEPAPDQPAEEGKPEEVDDEEMRSYSAKVQARINKLTANIHAERSAREAERRAKEASLRQLDEAARVTKGAIDEANRLKETIHKGENFWKETNKGRLESQIEAARNAYKTAYEAGDSEAVTTAQTKLTSLMVELDRTNSWNPQPLPPTAAPEPPPKPADPRAGDWHGKNGWFGNDVEMTGFALGVHQKLVNDRVDPTSETYYQSIDSEMRKRFPERFGQTNGTQAHQPVQSGGATVVAPANRSGKSPRKIQLTASQVSLAKRLGLTTQQYAAEVMKMSQT